MVRDYIGSMPTSFNTNLFCCVSFTSPSYINDTSASSIGLMYCNLYTCSLLKLPLFSVFIDNIKPRDVSVFSALPISLDLEGSIIYILFVRGANCVEFPYLL